MDGLWMLARLPIYAFEMYIWYIYYSFTLGRKEMDKKKFWAIFVGIYAISTILTSFGNPAFNAVCSLFMNLLILILLFQGNIIQKIFYLALLSILAIASEYMAYVTIDIFYSTLEVKIVHNSINYYIMALLSGKVYLYLIIRVFSRCFPRGKFEIDSKQLAFFLVMPISCILFFMVISTYVIDMNLKGFQKLAMLLSFIGIVVANMIVYVAFERAIKAEKSNKEAALERQMEAFNKTYYEAVEQKYTETQAILHDIKNHFSCLKGLLELGHVEKAQDYLNTIDLSMKNLKVVTYTSDKILNIILNDKKAMADKQDIDFEFFSDDLTLDFITDLDMCTIFGNLLDNALEAAGQSEDKIINVDVYLGNDDYITIKIENSCSQGLTMTEGKIQTSKADKEHHGIGLGNVRKTVEKYAGDLRLDYNAEAQTFSALIILAGQAQPIVRA